MLEAMEDIAMTSLLLQENQADANNNNNNKGRNQLDIYYDSLGAELKEVESTSKHYKMVQSYIDKSKNGAQIINLYKVDRWEEAKRFEPYRSEYVKPQEQQQQEAKGKQEDEKKKKQLYSSANHKLASKEKVFIF